MASLFATNWIFFLRYTILNDDLFVNSLMKVVAQPKMYDVGNCSCGLQSNCSKPIEIPFRTSNQSLTERSFAFLSGCVPFYSLPQSNLRCIYNQTCMELLQASVYYSKPMRYKILDYSSSSMPDTSIETLLSQLFVSEWFINRSLFRSMCSSILSVFLQNAI